MTLELNARRGLSTKSLNCGTAKYNAEARVQAGHGRMRRLIRKHLPRPKIVQPYPEILFLERLAARAV